MISSINESQTTDFEEPRMINTTVTYNENNGNYQNENTQQYIVNTTSTNDL